MTRRDKWCRVAANVETAPAELPRRNLQCECLNQSQVREQTLVGMENSGAP